jgi:hypothetical protein
VLLPAIVQPILFYGGIAIIGVALLVWSVLRDEKNAKRSTAGNLPEAAVIASAGGSRAHDLRRWSPALMFPVGILLTYVSVKHTTDVVIVSDDGARAIATRKVRFFGSNDYKLAPGTSRSDWKTDPTWVVNESTHTARVKTVHYGRRLGFGRDEPTLIPPGTAAEFSRVEHIGPTDSPPNQVEVGHGLGMDSRHWLLWD